MIKRIVNIFKISVLLFLIIPGYVYALTAPPPTVWSGGQEVGSSVEFAGVKKITLKAQWDNDIFGESDQGVDFEIAYMLLTGDDIKKDPVSFINKKDKWINYKKGSDIVIDPPMRLIAITSHGDYNDSDLKVVDFSEAGVNIPDEPVVFVLPESKRVVFTPSVAAKKPSYVLKKTFSPELGKMIYEINLSLPESSLGKMYYFFGDNTADMLSYQGPIQIEVDKFKRLTALAKCEKGECKESSLLSIEVLEIFPIAKAPIIKFTDEYFGKQCLVGQRCFAKSTIVTILSDQPRTTLYYKLNNGSWVRYAGPFEVADESLTITAKAVGKEDYRNSDLTEIKLTKIDPESLFELSLGVMSFQLKGDGFDIAAYGYPELDETLPLFGFGQKFDHGFFRGWNLTAGSLDNSLFVGLQSDFSITPYKFGGMDKFRFFAEYFSTNKTYDEMLFSNMGKTIKLVEEKTANYNLLKVGGSVVFSLLDLVDLHLGGGKYFLSMFMNNDLVEVVYPRDITIIKPISLDGAFASLGLTINATDNLSVDLCGQYLAIDGLAGLQALANVSFFF